MASFEQAMSLPQTIASCPVFGQHEVPPGMPSCSLFARIDGDFDERSPGDQARLLREHAHEQGINPDFMVYASGGSVYAGSISQPVGFGLAVSTPTYRPQASAWCFRIALSSTGVTSEDNGFVVAVTDESRRCGILEGDTLVSLNGNSVKRTGGMPSAWDACKLLLKPGTEVEVVWIRPGNGRMSGVLTTQPNVPMPAWGSQMASARAKPKRYVGP